MDMLILHDEVEAGDHDNLEKQIAGVKYPLKPTKATFGHWTL